MDRKAIAVFAISIALLFTWPWVAQKIYPPIPAPAVPTNAVTSAAGAPPLVGVTNGSLAGLPAAATNGLPAAGAVPLPPIRPSGPEELVVLTNQLARYTFTTHGGGIKLVELLRYPETVACFGKNAIAPTNVASLNTRAPLPAFSLAGNDSLTGDGVFALTRTPYGIRATKQLPSHNIIKEFEIGTNYQLNCTIRIENTAPVPRQVPAHEVLVGTATPMGPIDDALKVGFYWGEADKSHHYDGNWFRNATLGCFPGTPRFVFQEGSSNVFWTAVHNQFFALATIPKTPADQVISRKINLPPPTQEEIDTLPKVNRQPVGFQTSLSYGSTNLAPGAVLEHRYSIYAGPKEYSRLAKLAADFKLNLDIIMGFDQVLFGSFSGFFAKLLLLALNGIHSLGLSYGLTIIVITILVKLLFWPLTKASTQSMKRMAALQPEMKKLQERYKSDPEKLNRKMMEFWKEHKVNPFGGCLPILLQMPVFIGFFAMIQTAIELRGASFLWACDLTHPDTIFIIPGIHFPFNPLPLLMGVTMFWQAKLQPASPGMDPMQQKMMKYMPLMFLVFLYNFSSGLTLYWTVQNLLGILQTKLTRTNDDPKPAAAAAASAGPGHNASSRKKKDDE